jgi:hypothetical protein
MFNSKSSSKSMQEREATLSYKTIGFIVILLKILSLNLGIPHNQSGWILGNTRNNEIFACTQGLYAIFFIQVCVQMNFVDFSGKRVLCIQDLI